MSGQMRVGSLFSGYEGIGMAVEQVWDAKLAWVSDIDPGACKILAHRYPDLPNHGDITKIDWNAVEPVDILTGGFPCQDLSHAGKRAGLKGGTRSGLWSYMAEAIDQLRPRYVVAENVRGLLSACAHSDLEPCPRCVGGAGKHQPVLRALGRVLGDLADIGGYDVRWTGIRAADVGAPHNRFRVFVLATDTRRSDWRREDPTRSAASWFDLAAGGRHEGAGSPVGSRGDGAAEDTHGAARGERWQPAPGQAEGGRARSDAGRRGGASAAAPATPANPSGERHGRGQDRREVGRVDGGAEGEARQRERARAESGDRGAEVAADADGLGRDGVSKLNAPAPARIDGEHRGHADRRDDGAGRGSGAGSTINWGVYAPAIERWQRVLGRVAPAPTETSPKGSQRLSPRFVEWLMGLPAGWVTDVPDLNRNAQLKALGNGVVPAQALAAITYMLNAERMAA